ncbi:MAG: hypothetical protein PUE73_06685 [Eubacteriales bacterium]|nr:hypothetical protein [Eubacteriales bacterium]
MKHIKKYISSLLAISMVAGSLTVGLLAYGADAVAIDSANFPDKNWRTVVSNEYDGDGDGFLSLDERQTTEISLSALLENYCGETAEIYDLAGIEYFSNLKRLYCGGVGLESLDVSGLGNLAQLTCQGNNMTTLTLGTQSNLTWLNCASNELTALDVSGCTALTRLNCQINNLKSLDATACVNLEELFCQQNELTEINIRGLTALQTIYCANNHLWELDLSTNSGLQEVTAYMLDNQTVDAVAEVEGSEISIAHDFIREDRIVSTSFDEGEGNNKVSGFSAGYFVTHDPEKILDGVDYKYYTGNTGADNMSVHINVSRGFHVVRYYMDDTMTTLYDSQVVLSGENAVAPEITEAPACKTFAGWSQEANGVTADMNIYALWDAKHNFVFVTFKHGQVQVKCADCQIEDTLDFMDSFGASRGDSNYMEELDVVTDGFINAKDYAKLSKDYRYS